MTSKVKSRAAWRGNQIGAALLLMSLGSSASAQAPSFDGRGWTAGHQQQDGARSIIEYVLPGQTVDNWKELVTSTVFFQPVPVAPFVEQFHASLAQGCPSLVWTVIRQDEKTAVFEWRDSGCGGFEATSELARVTIDRDGLHRLAYTVKGAFRTERRKAWLAILDQVPLAEGAARGAAAEGTPAAEESGEKAALRAKVTKVFVGFVRQSGQPCSSPARAEMKEQRPGPQGPLTEWLLACSDGARYTVLVQPSGAMSAFKTSK